MLICPLGIPPYQTVAIKTTEFKMAAILPKRFIMALGGESIVRKCDAPGHKAKLDFKGP